MNPLLRDQGRGPFPVRALLLTWGLICAGLCALFWRDIAILRLSDPDDVMRLVQVRDLVAGQSWFDLQQHRVAPPEGTLMHWSRLVDLPIAALIVLLRPLLGAGGAETAALLIVPALTLLATLYLAMRLCLRVFDRETAIVGGVLMALSGPVLHQMRPLRIDHHGWQIVMTLVALNGLAARDPRKGGWTVGLAIAGWLTISLEGLPVAALFIGVLALRGLRRDRDWRWLLHAMAALAAGAAALFLATRGLGDLAQHCDQISPVHLAIFAMGAAGCAAVARLGLRPVPAMASFAAIALAAVGTVALAAPQCTRGAFGELDPWVAKVWLDNITEGLPLWHSQAGTIASLVSFVPAGCYGIWNLWRRAPREQAAGWLEYGLLLAGATVVGVLVARAMTTAGAIALLPAAWQFRRWRIAALRADTVRRLVIDLGLVAAALPIIPVIVAVSLVTPEKAEEPVLRLGRCQFAEGLKRAAALPATQIFAPVDIGPEILRRTPHRVVATGHHRAQAGIRDVMLAFVSPPEKAREIIRARQAAWVVVCTAAPEMDLYREMNGKGLGAMLKAGQAPDWLEPVDLAPAKTNVRFWRVRD